MIIEDDTLHNIFKNDIYYKDTVFEKMEKLRKLDSNTDEYNNLYQDIIRVVEYQIQ